MANNYDGHAVLHASTIRDEGDDGYSDVNVAEGDDHMVIEQDNDRVFLSYEQAAHVQTFLYLHGRK